MWKSGTSVALLGVVADFIDAEGESTSILLTLPMQQGGHTDTNTAGNSACIITQYGLERSLGLLVMDDANNNATCMLTLAEGFQRSVRAGWIRCSDHNRSLVA